jgi:dTDP-4-dehydrorhamnose 3,5-epimerase
MKVTETKLKGVLIIEPNVFGDNRGWFSETYNKQKMQDFGIDTDFVQDNHSFSVKKSTLRGMHLQNSPYVQSKLVRCTRGAVLDVAVDLRKDSTTYKQWVSVELTAENRKQIFIPKGFAHGFLTLTDNVEIQYKVDNYYNKEAERGFRFDDPEICIDWGVTTPILSEKDRVLPFLKDSDIKI